MRGDLFPFLLAPLALVACAQQPAQERESAGEYAARIDGSSSAEGGVTMDHVQATSDAGATMPAGAPAGADVLRLEPLGDVADADLGPRDGGCSFAVGGRQMLIAAAMRERTLPGKAVIRVAGQPVVLDSQPGGLAMLKSGQSFAGEGVTARISPTGVAARSRPATLTMTDAEGATQTYSGEWICA